MEIKHANGFKRGQESAQRVGLLGLQQVQDAPRPVLAEDDKDKILVACSDSAFEQSQVSPPWSYPAAAALGTPARWHFPSIQNQGPATGPAPGTPQFLTPLLHVLTAFWDTSST